MKNHDYSSPLEGVQVPLFWPKNDPSSGVWRVVMDDSPEEDCPDRTTVERCLLQGASFYGREPAFRRAAKLNALLLDIRKGTARELTDRLEDWRSDPSTAGLPFETNPVLQDDHFLLENVREERPAAPGAVPSWEEMDAEWEKLERKEKARWAPAPRRAAGGTTARGEAAWPDNEERENEQQGS